MNNQHHQQNDFFDPILQHYHSLPPITRSWFTLSLIITTLQTLDVFAENQLVFQWHRLAPPHLELWRILTSFSWAGPGTLVDFPVLMLLYSMAVVVPTYERNPHDAFWLENQNGGNNDQNNRGRRRQNQQRRSKHAQSDCLFAFVACSLLIVLTYLLLTETYMISYIAQHYLSLPPHFYDQLNLMPIFTRTLLYAIITLQSLKHPNVHVNINFFPVPGRYVPLFHVLFGVLMGYRINEIVHGIMVGWVYACLVEEDGRFASLVGRKRIIFTPQWLVLLVGEDFDIIDNNAAAAREATGNENNHHNNNHGAELETGANLLHRAAAIGDLSFLHQQLEEVDAVLLTATSAAEIAMATASFRQPDRNGWQPLHEAARGGRVDALKFLLEIEDVCSSTDENDERRIQRRRRPVKLKINVNARTNHGRGCTALWLAQNEHGVESECAEIVRSAGGVSLGYGEEVEVQQD